MSRTIEFLFDYVSPYAYLAWTQIRSLARRHGSNLRRIPVLFAGLLQANGQLGPAEIPRKRLYMFKDALRTANVLGVPLIPPPSHPFNPLLALRVTCAEIDAPHTEHLIDRLFHAAWGSGQGVETPAQVARVLRELELDADEVITRASSPIAKQRLRDETDRALASGSFGVPTMLVNDELFWGCDSLGHLDRYLAGQESLDPSLIEQWRVIVPTAERRDRA